MRRPPCGVLALSQRVFFLFVLFFFILISAAHRCACEAKSQFQFHVGVLSGAKRGGGGNGKDGGVPGKTSDFDANPPSHAHGHALTTSQEGYSPCNECAQHEWDRRLCYSKELQKQMCINWVERKTDFIKPTWGKRRRERHFSH